jgi:hypothetical protein
MDNFEGSKVVTFRYMSTHTRDLSGMNQKGMMREMYQRILHDLIEKGMFRISSVETPGGDFRYEIALDVRAPSDYGDPKWYNI